MSQSPPRSSRPANRANRPAKGGTPAGGAGHSKSRTTESRPGGAPVRGGGSSAPRAPKAGVAVAERSGGTAQKVADRVRQPKPRAAAATAEPKPERPQPPIHVEIPAVTWDPSAPPLRYDVSTTRPTLLGKYRGAWVIDKPSGWLVHPASNDPAPVLDEWIQGELRPNGTVSPIHRLDKETSGLVLVSDRGDVRGELGQIFAGHDIDKTYIAVVHGRCHRKGIIRRKIQDGARMVNATTRYRLLRWIGPYSLLIARPEEGRKHQIRRHFSAIGHPLLGDARYGELRPWLGDEPGRLALHAFRLVFADGTVLEAPLAPELTVLLGRLAARYGSAG